MNNRVLVCVEIWYNKGVDPYKFSFFEPTKDSISDLSPSEIDSMVSDGIFKDHTPQDGRRLK